MASHHQQDPPFIAPGLEPEARDFANTAAAAGVAVTLKEAAQHSAAISLRRIADRLDALDATAFGNQLLDIAWRAGQNFRGKP